MSHTEMATVDAKLAKMHSNLKAQVFCRVDEYVANNIAIAKTSGAKQITFVVAGNRLDDIGVADHAPDQIITHVLNKFTGWFFWSNKGRVERRGDYWVIVISW